MPMLMYAAWSHHSMGIDTHIKKVIYIYNIYIYIYTHTMNQVWVDLMVLALDHEKKNGAPNQLD